MEHHPDLIPRRYGSDDRRACSDDMTYIRVRKGEGLLASSSSGPIKSVGGDREAQGGSQRGTSRRAGTVHRYFQSIAGGYSRYFPPYTNYMAQQFDEKGVEAERFQKIATQDIANKTMWTFDTAHRLVVDAATANPGNGQAAAQQVATAAGSVSGAINLTLTNPNPLSSTFRGIAAGALFAVQAVVVVLIATAHSNGAAEYVVLGLLGGFSWLGIVLFVMGYQNVVVSGNAG
jgi:hypothetical protein